MPAHVKASDIRTFVHSAFLAPVIDAAVSVVSPEWLRDVPGVANWYLQMFGAVVVILLVWLPDGLLSTPDRLKATRNAG